MQSPMRRQLLYVESETYSTQVHRLISDLHLGRSSRKPTLERICPALREPLVPNSVRLTEAHPIRRFSSIGWTHHRSPHPIRTYVTEGAGRQVEDGSCGHKSQCRSDQPAGEKKESRDRSCPAFCVDRKSPYASTLTLALFAAQLQCMLVGRAELTSRLG